MKTMALGILAAGVVVAAAGSAQAQGFTPTVAFCQEVVGSGVVNGAAISVYQATNAIPVGRGGFETLEDKTDALEKLWTAQRDGAWWKLRRLRFGAALKRLQAYEEKIQDRRGRHLTITRADRLLLGSPFNCDLDPASANACTQYGAAQAIECVTALMR
jgi:hypothetical protein